MASEAVRFQAADDIVGDVVSAKGAAGNARQNKKINDTVKNKCAKMEKLRKREIRKWWEVTSLQRYNDVNRVP